MAALREIAAGALNLGALREAAIERRLQNAAVEEREDDTPEPPAGDNFERRNEAAIAADREPLPVAGTTREQLFAEDAEGEAEARPD